MVSENGDLYSINRKRFIFSRLKKHGYFEFCFYTNYKKREFHLAHRLVAQYFLKDVPGKKIVNHKDFNRENNHYLNLEWTTSAENNDHAVSNFRKNKISLEDFKLIHDLKGSLPQKVLAKKFNVGLRTIQNIIHKTGSYSRKEWDWKSSQPS